MTGLILQTASWGLAILGIYLIIYTLMKWRRAAKACHPMPFRRRKGYLRGLAFSTLFLASPALVPAEGGVQPYFATLLNLA